VSWLLDDWRLKLLALLLAILMLGAVAFAQNPSTSHTFANLPINYTLPSNLVIINPQRAVSATVYGPSDTVATMTDNSLIATVDASKAAPGPAVKLTIVITSLVNTVQVTNRTIPIAANIDVRATQDLPVQVITHPVAGWSVTRAIALCGSTTQACVVHFDGPQSWEKSANLTASVNYTTPIQASNYASDNWTIQLRNTSGVIDPLACNTSPPCGLDVTTVSVEVQAQPGSTSTTVPLIDAPPAQGPPSGYRVTGVTISPVTINITGDPTVLAKIQRITLPAMDLSAVTSSHTFTVNIPLPDGVSIIGPSGQAKITYVVERNPNASPSP
jgi:YbbR domain-containing protein